MLALVPSEPSDGTSVNLRPTREAIVTWNTRSPCGDIELRLGAYDGRTSAWLPYVRFDPSARRSFESQDTFVRIDTDVIRADVDLVSVAIRSTLPFDALFVSTPRYGVRSAGLELPAVELAVPPYSQYDARYRSERGWCAPASLAMLLAYHGYSIDVPAVAREVFDGRYGGTGNWAFNMAFAGTLGLRAAVVYLRDLAHAHAFLIAGIPLALSIAWAPGELSGAPLLASNGHLVALRGIAQDGTALVNDPARPGVAHAYARSEFERAWLSHGGIAFAVVPAQRTGTLLRLANA